MMNFVFKTRNFVPETRNCVLKTRNYALKMMDFEAAAEEGGRALRLRVPQHQIDRLRVARGGRGGRPDAEGLQVSCTSTSSDLSIARHV